MQAYSKWRQRFDHDCFLLRIGGRNIAMKKLAEELLAQENILIEEMIQPAIIGRLHLSSLRRLNAEKVEFIPQVFRHRLRLIGERKEVRIIVSLDVGDAINWRYRWRLWEEMKSFQQLGNVSEINDRKRPIFHFSVEVRTFPPPNFSIEVNKDLRSIGLFLQQFYHSRDDQLRRWWRWNCRLCWRCHWFCGGWLKPLRRSGRRRWLFVRKIKVDGNRLRWHTTQDDANLQRGNRGECKPRRAS